MRLISHTTGNKCCPCLKLSAMLGHEALAVFALPRSWPAQPGQVRSAACTTVAAGCPTADTSIVTALAWQVLTLCSHLPKPCFDQWGASGELRHLSRLRQRSGLAALLACLVLLLLGLADCMCHGVSHVAHQMQRPCGRVGGGVLRLPDGAQELVNGRQSSTCNTQQSGIPGIMSSLLAARELPVAAIAMPAPPRQASHFSKYVPSRRLG